MPTKENPADLLSGGLFPEQLQNNKFWFEGPTWLSFSENSWPSNENFNEKIENESALVDELKPIKVNAVNEVLDPTHYFLNYCSNYIQLLRYTTWYRRFFDYLRNKNQVKIEQLSSNELNTAKLR